MWFFNSGTDMGIDLGTATVLVYVKGKGIVLKEPSVVAIDKNTNKVLAVGESARQMIGKTPGNIIAIRPLRDGVISDYDITEKMFKYFIKKVFGKKRVYAPKIMACIPSGATEIEKRAVIDAARNSGARSVYLIEEPLAAAIGAKLDISKAKGHMVVDIGGGTTDIAVISLGGVVVRKSIKIAGDNFDDAIIKFIRNKYKLMIGERTAEALKINVASAIPSYRDEKMDVKGRSMINGLPNTISISTDELRLALQDEIKTIAYAVRIVLEQTPPELSADILEEGIIMTGGGSLLNGLDIYLHKKTSVKTSVVKDAVGCVAMGTGKVLEIFNKNYIGINESEISLIK